MPPAPSPTVLAVFDPSKVTLGTEEVANGFKKPLFVTPFAGDPTTLLVVEQAGTIRRMQDQQVFLDITDRVGSQGNEQGLLGLAFDPKYQDNHYFYVNYTNKDGDTRISRFSVGVDGAGSPDSEKVLIAQEQPASNHNGGMLAFGPDGYLYIGLGDGGGANDQYGNAQRLDTLLGKILRIDVSMGDPYAIPPDNPFVGRQDARPEIWAHGMRNPWRFSFDRATGDLYIGHVGQNKWEWVDFQPAGSPGGQNYGWPMYEGSHCVKDSCDPQGITMPVAEYSHDDGCSITGGYVYRGGAFPTLQGAYLFSDYCSGRIWALARDASGKWVTTEMLHTDLSVSSFGEDSAGELYVTDISGGGIYHVTAKPRGTP
jgi:glucose/arabinose dehydrogenase